MTSESVEPLLDPAADTGYCFRLGGPDVAVAELGLQGGPERLGGGVVPAEPGPLARNDYNDGEFCVPAFSADRSILFVNIQSPGYTLVITGPWCRPRNADT